MSDIRTYVEKRKASDPVFAEDFDSGYADFKIGVLLRQARENAGLTQEEVARRLGTKKSAISRMENHANDVRLSMLRNYAEVIGASLEITLTQPKRPLPPSVDRRNVNRISGAVSAVAEAQEDYQTDSD